MRLYAVLPAIAAQENKRQDEAHCLGQNGRVPQRLPAEDGGEEQQHRALQHEAAADGDADGRKRTLERSQKPADDDVEADEQIRNAVAAEGVDGVFDKLARGVREIGAHDLGGEEENEHKLTVVRP